GCAIAVGPHVGNFTDHVAMLRAAKGLTVVQDATELTRWVDALLRDPARRQGGGGGGGPRRRPPPLPPPPPAVPQPPWSICCLRVRADVPQPPAFWRRGGGGLLADLLSPLGLVTTAVT